MLGLISAERGERPGAIGRWRSGWQRGYGIRAEERRLFGRGALHVRHQVFDYLSERQSLRRLDDLRGLLRVNHVDKVAFARDFPGRERLGALEAVSSRYLHTCLAGDVGAAVAGDGGDTAVVFARTVGLQEERAILQLCGAFRYLIVEAGRENEAVCQNLRRRYGLPVIENPTASQLRRANFALVFQAPRAGAELGDRCIAFAPDGSQYRAIRSGRRVAALDLALPEEMAAAIPDGFEADPILSEAAIQGLIDPGKIKINGLSLDKLS